MIKTRPLKETDKPPFLCTCESNNGSLIVFRAEEHDFARGFMKGEIISGLGTKENGLATGVRRSFHPYAEWRKIISTKDKAEQPPAMKIEISSSESTEALKWCVSRSKRSARGPIQPIWLTFETPVKPSAVAAHIINMLKEKDPNWTPFKYADIHVANV